MENPVRVCGGWFDPLYPIVGIHMGQRHWEYKLPPGNELVEQSFQAERVGFELTVGSHLRMHQFSPDFLRESKQASFHPTFSFE